MDATPPEDRQRSLRSPTFLAFLVTQFLGALNDNMFRWLAIPIARDHFPKENESYVLGAGLACIVVPFILLASYAGFLADRFSKRTVIVGCKIAEIAIMLVGALVLGSGQVYLLFGVVLMMGSQSALFGPSKLGIIPEVVPRKSISSANGFVGLTTIIAIVIGSIAGGYLYELTDHGQSRIWIAGLAGVGVATCGWLVSMLIHRLPAADPQRKFPINPAAETIRDLRLLGKDRGILRVALGIAFFWSLASMAQINIDTYVLNLLSLEQKNVGQFLAVLTIGVGCGNILAGWLSAGKVELGLVPLGALAIAISAVVLSTTFTSYYATALFLFLLGLGGGLFLVPLQAYLQRYGHPKSLGSLLAASNFLTFSGMLCVAGLFPILQGEFNLDAGQVFLVAGLGTLPVAAYAFLLLPSATMRFVVWLMSHTVYRVRVSGRDNIPEEGGALLVANHISWIDGILLLLASSRPIRMVAYADYVHVPGLNWFADKFGVIPIKSESGPKSILRSLKTARQAVLDGHLVCIFAEGQISRTGQLLPFQRGMMRIIQGTDAPVIPVFLDGLWGSIFSYSGGKVLWKRPKRWPYPVDIRFGQHMVSPDDVDDVRNAVEELGVEAVTNRKQQEMVPIRKFLRQCKSARFRSKVADSTGAELTGGKLLAGTMVVYDLLKKHVLDENDRMVGILLPPSVGGFVANSAVSLSGRVAVNLNYTLSNDDVNYCLKKCNIRQVLTSRKFLDKRPFDLDAEFVFLEDLRPKATGLQKLTAAFKAFVVPAFILDALYGLNQIPQDDLLTIIFTSGSTGSPKGVMLSNYNITSNIRAVDDLFNIKETDVLLGVLPFFHSFGYTVTLWLTGTLPVKTVYHFNPLDGRLIGKLCGQHGTTILVATPTFLRTYLKRCSQEQMQHLDLVAVGAEKMPVDLANAFEEKFGIAPIEGYGTTELSPVAAFNVPLNRCGNPEQSGVKMGTVGRVMPGTMAKIVHPETFEDLEPGGEGLLMIKGPNVMQGYLDEPEKTGQAIRDGWYNTGDIARIDDEGFIEITGRQSRFSKIGGEMVPHLKIEETLASLIDDHSDDEEPEIQVAVTSVPDEKKGERLIVIHRPLSKTVAEVLKDLAETGLPNLWIPSADSFLQVDEIPILGTGKLDLSGLKNLALEAFAAEKTADA